LYKSVFPVRGEIRYKAIEACPERSRRDTDPPAGRAGFTEIRKYDISSEFSVVSVAKKWRKR
jgi:hypothetical protein